MSTGWFGNKLNRFRLPYDCGEIVEFNVERATIETGRSIRSAESVRKSAVCG